MNILVNLVNERLDGDSRKGTRDSGRNKRLREAATLAQHGRCVWCRGPLDLSEPSDSALAVQLDRLASGRERGRCDCSGSCRCGYLEGAVAAAHRACHDPEQGARYRLTAREQLALASAYAPTVAELGHALRSERRAAGTTRTLREASEAALVAAREAAAALL